MALASHETFESEVTLNLETIFVVAPVAVLVSDAVTSESENETDDVSDGVLVRRFTPALAGVEVRV